MKRTLFVLFGFLTMVSLRGQWLDNVLAKKSGMAWGHYDRLPRYKKMTILSDKSIYDSLDGHLLKKGLEYDEEHVVHGDTLTVFRSHHSYIPYFYFFNDDSTLNKLIIYPQDAVTWTEDYFYKKGKLNSIQRHGFDTTITTTAYVYRGKRLVRMKSSGNRSTHVTEYRFQWRCGKLRAQSFEQADTVCYWKYIYTDRGRTIRCVSNMTGDVTVYQLNENGQIAIQTNYKTGMTPVFSRFEYYPNRRLKSIRSYSNGQQISVSNYFYE